MNTVSLLSCFLPLALLISSHSIFSKSAESSTRNLEAESIRSRSESTGGCVKLKTVTLIRQSSARGTSITESVYLVLKSLWGWDPVERLKQRNDMVSLTLFFQDEANCIVLNATKAVDRESRHIRKERIAVVKA